MFMYYLMCLSLYNQLKPASPCISTESSPGNPLASILKCAGSAGIPVFSPGPVAVGEVSSSISWMNGEPEVYIEDLT